jgi:hypothetical protein
MAGAVGEVLAGFEPSDGARGDFAGMGLLRRLSGRGARFDEESAAGAELQLRLHWRAVRGVADLLGQLGTLTPSSAAELVRMELRKPARPLVTDADTLVRLADALGDVPELHKPLEAALLRAA